MSKSNEICRIMIVDNNLECAIDIAYELEQFPPALLNNLTLKIEISNSAYFVAEQIEKYTGKTAPWDIILSDVYMPIPSSHKQREVAQKVADKVEIKDKNQKYTWKSWQYKYSWNSTDKGSPEHGGYYLVRKIGSMKKKFQALKNLKVILISDQINDPFEKYRIFDSHCPDYSWLNYYDKTDWDDNTKNWPNSSSPKMFRWAIINAIKDRRLESWGHIRSNFLPYSKTMEELLIKGEIFARDHQTVDTILITGERGTGKTRLAQKLHTIRMAISKGTGEFVTVDSTRSTLFESQLFGHVKGAFTDASDHKKGFIEAAKDGTLFFDEIGDLIPPNQGKLLRLLQDKKYVRVGDNEDKILEAKLVIFATNKNLFDLVRNEDFRSDLFDRMNFARIGIPPLRERKDEIVPLAKNFLTESKKFINLSEDAAKLLKGHHWPGNVRELETVIKRAAIFCTSRDLTVRDIESAIDEISGKITSTSAHINQIESQIQITPENIVAGKLKWKQIQQNSEYSQRAAILLVARSLWKGRRAKFANLLAVTPDTFYQFFSTVKKEIKNRNLNIQDLKPHVIPDHHPILDEIYGDIVNS